MAMIAPKTSARAVPTPRAALGGGGARAKQPAAPPALPAAAALALLATPLPAHAAASDKLMDLLASSSDTIAGAIEASKPFAGVASEAAKQAADKALPVAKSALETAVPVASDAASKLVAAAKPLSESAIKLLAEQGVDTTQVSDVASKTATVAGPTVEKTIGVLQGVVAALSAQDPQDLAVYAAIAGALYLTAPALLGALVVALRGYAGSYTPLQALDVLVTEPNSVLVDIRSDSEVAASGIPDVPRAVKGKVNRVPSGIESSNLRGQFKDVNTVEDGVAAMRVAGLKRVSRGTQVLLLDSKGGKSASIAKRLAAMGYGQVYVINGGFNGWKQSQLPTKAAIAARGVEVLPPGGATGLLQLPGGR